MSKEIKGDISKKKRFKTFFSISMIGVCFVLVFWMFKSCAAGMEESKLDPDSIRLVQYELPADEDEVVVFETSVGTFKAVLYPERVPKYCKYFKDLVNSGYYDGTHIFAVEYGVYALGGAKAKDGTDTKDTDTTEFDQELSSDLWPFSGALIAYGGRSRGFLDQTVLSGSRILFVNSVEFTPDFVAELDSVEGNKDLIEAFKKKGGVPNFSQQYTIFAQVYDGFDAYNKMCTVDVKDKENLNPVEDIVINKAYISTYGENRNDDFFTLEGEYITTTPEETSQAAK